MGSENKLDPVAGPIICTAGWGLVIFFILYANQWFAGWEWGPWVSSKLAVIRVHSLWAALGISATWTLLHPVVGKLFALLAVLMCDGVDYLFEIDDDTRRWGGWGAEQTMWFAVFWPISGPITILSVGATLIYGLLYTSLFRK